MIDLRMRKKHNFYRSFKWSYMDVNECEKKWHVFLEY